MYMTAVPSPEDRNSILFTTSIPSNKIHELSIAYPSPVLDGLTLQKSIYDEAIHPVHYSFSSSYSSLSAATNPTVDPKLDQFPRPTSTTMSRSPSGYSTSPTLSSYMPMSDGYLDSARTDLAYTAAGPYQATRITRDPQEYIPTIQPGMLAHHQEQHDDGSAAFSRAHSVSSSASHAVTSSCLTYPPVVNMTELPPQAYPPAQWTGSEPQWNQHMEPCHLAITNEHSPASQGEAGASVIFHSGVQGIRRRSMAEAVKQEEDYCESTPYFTAAEDGEGEYEAATSQGDVASMQRRLGEKNEYACEICNKSFSRHWNYRSHKETHQNQNEREKPHRCDYAGCDLSFRRPTDLKRHQNCVHKRSKEFKCGLCGAGFPRKDSLSRHESDGCSKRTSVKRRTKVGKSSSPKNASNRTSRVVPSASSAATQPSPPLAMQTSFAAPYLHEYRVTTSNYPRPPLNSHEHHQARAMYAEPYGPAYANSNGRLISCPQWQHMPFYGTENQELARE